MLDDDPYTESRLGDDYFFGLEGPLDDAPGSGQMRAANLRGFLDFIRLRNGDPTRILGRFGLDVRTIANPESHITCQQCADILEYCATVFDDPLFGLRLAQSQNAEVYGCVTTLCRSAPDVRTAIQAFVDFIPVVHAPEAAIEFITGEMAELRWAVRSDLGVNDQANFQALILNLKLLKLLIGESFQPIKITLAIDRRSRDVPAIEQLVGHQVVMQASHNAIQFSTKCLDQTLGSSDRLTYRLLGGYLGRLKIVNRANTVERVQSYVRGALPSGICSIERCAEQMGVSVRTLQVRLANHNVRYADLVETQREKLARIYLRQTRMPLDEVAERLGYGEQTSFGRAFKRWTGVTPQKFRIET